MWRNVYENAIFATLTLESYDTALKILSLQISYSRYLPPRSTIAAVLRFLNRLKFPTKSDAKSAKLLIDTLTTTMGSQLSEMEFSNYLNVCVMAGEMEMAEVGVRAASEHQHSHEKPKSPVFYSILLKGWGRTNNLEQVDRTMGEIGKNGIVVDTILLNSAISAYVKCGQIGKAKIILSKMETASPPLTNINSYNTILTGYRDVSESLPSFEPLFAVASKISRWDSVTYSIMIDAACRRNDVALAERFLSEIESNFIITDSSTSVSKKKKNKIRTFVEAYTILLSFYAKTDGEER